MTEETGTKPNLLLKRKEDQELRIYFFIGNRPMTITFPPSPPPHSMSDKKIIYVVGFKLEEAFGTAKIKGEGYNLIFTGQSPTVREFLHEMELESLAYEALKEGSRPLPQPAKKPEERLSPVQMSFEKFRAGLLFCANEGTILYQNPEDKKTLKRIIGGLRSEEEL